MYTNQEITDKLMSIGYYPDEQISCAVSIALNCNKPLLIEGAPGAGKTSLASSVAKMLGLPIIRVQMYEGLTDDKILYDYDYQKQLLTLEAIKPSIQKECDGKSISESIASVSSQMNFYGKDFLIERPILRTINGSGRKVLLLDEIDKAPEEIEYMLLEFFEDYSISIPQYGKIVCPEDQKPIVFLTSNNYRELSGAMKRRCVYLYIHPKNEIEMTRILMTRCNVNEKLAQNVAKCIIATADISMRQKPSVAEAIDWAKMLSFYPSLSKEIVMGSLGLLVKNQNDMGIITDIVKKRGKALWED